MWDMLTGGVVFDDVFQMDEQQLFVPLPVKKTGWGFNWGNNWGD